MNRQWMADSFILLPNGALHSVDSNYACSLSLSLFLPLYSHLSACLPVSLSVSYKFFYSSCCLYFGIVLPYQTGLPLWDVALNPNRPFR